MEEKNRFLARVLEDNAKEYYENGFLAESKGQFNSSVTLFFKAISSLSDLCILKNKGVMPSNHTERFRILEKEFPEIYKILDTDFSFYQDSYRSKLNKEISEMLKNDARHLFKKLSIKI